MVRVKRKIDNRALNAYAKRERRRVSSLLASILTISLASMITFFGVVLLALAVM